MIKIGRVVLLQLMVFCILMSGFTNVHGQKLLSKVLGVDVRFTSGDSALKIPFELHNNLIYIQVSVNNSKPLSFLLDTGSSHVLDLQQAKALGLKLKFQGQAAGVGERAVDFYSSKGVSFSLPGVSVSGQEVGVIPLDGVSACASEAVADEKGHLRKCEPNEQCQRRVIDGILGHDFIKRFVVEIDYEARLLNLYPPGNYKYQGTGESFPLDIVNQKIFVQGRLSPVGRPPLNGRFVIDTGGAHALFLTTPFVEINGLIPRASESTKFSACGIGGYSEVLIGKLSAFELGKLKFSEPVTGFSRAQNGDLAEGIYDGNIGGAILRHFKVIFDYSRRKMILESPSKS